MIAGPPKGMYWRFAEERFLELDRDGRIWWGKNGNNVPRLKRFLSEVRQGVIPQTLWMHREVGNTQEAKKELVSIIEYKAPGDVFITPQPVRLLRRIIEIGADKDSIVMDSFAGSGTTGHAVLAINAEDGGRRKFVMVEMDKKIATDVAGQRLRKVIEGYTPLTGQNPAPVAGLGGGVRYCTLGEPLFDEAGQIRSAVSASELAAHVYLAETGSALSSAPEQLPLIGEHGGEAIYLLHNGILGDRRPEGGNVLTQSVLAGLPPFDGPKVVYGEGCRLGAARLARERITFKQIPYQIKVR
jgi:site-specific DNA-methyltransferase (adenine-specific)/adenine-specific DNA-methyltransferase